MAFQSVNEIDKFSFRDCELYTFEVTPQGISMELEALIVEPDNSQNTNYTRSYAGTTLVRLLGGEVLEAWKEGYRYYDANDRLIEDVPDAPISFEDFMKLLKPAMEAGVYLFTMEKESADEKMIYSLGIDLNESDSYRIKVSFEKAVFTWERYMNRVQD